MGFTWVGLLTPVLQEAGVTACDVVLTSLPGSVYSFALRPGAPMTYAPGDVHEASMDGRGSFVSISSGGGAQTAGSATFTAVIYPTSAAAAAAVGPTRCAARFIAIAFLCWFFLFFH